MPTAIGAWALTEVHELASDLADEHHPYDVEGFGRRDTQPAAELRSDAETVQHLRYLRAAAVDDDDVDARSAELGDVGREGFLELGSHHRVAAVLHDHGGAAVRAEVCHVG